MESKMRPICPKYSSPETQKAPSKKYRVPALKSYSIIQIRSNYAKLFSYKSRGEREQKSPLKYPEIRAVVVLFLTTKNWVKMALVMSNQVKPYQLVWV